MLRVALTGGVCSGKSAAAAIFRELGCVVSQSDEVARGMMQPGEDVYRRIVERFGSHVVRADGTLDRAVLAQIAFHESRAEELNTIVHPAVIAWQNTWMREVAAEHPSAVAMVESALVFETRHGGEAEAPWRSRFDRIVLVTAPAELRLRRYFARVGASSTQERAAAETDMRARMAAQLTDAEKASLSDVVIHNDRSLADLRRKVEEVWEQLRVEAEDAADEAM